MKTRKHTEEVMAVILGLEDNMTVIELIKLCQDNGAHYIISQHSGSPVYLIQFTDDPKVFLYTKRDLEGREVKNGRLV